ncbi:MAG: M1 family metallopeptidase, partial [Deltaproteobacteria bacterium]
MAHPTLDQNFRLSMSVRPRRVEARLSVDLEARAFTGREAISVSLAGPEDELVLHAVELDIGRASFRTAGREIVASGIELVAASETAILRFPERLPAGEGTLTLDWHGRFSKGLRGLYLAKSIAVTQFEACDARRVFPCFDEPAFKAVWALTLEVPKDAIALANGAPKEERPVGEGRKLVAFEETPPLSSYLVALAVGPLAGTPAQKARRVPVRTWAVPEKVGLAAFGQDVAVNVLPRLEDYFGLPYGFGKVDQVGIPDFEAGAMENAGLVTYREVALLLDPKTASLPVLKRVAEVVTHELSHQWFGNWVTMAWWDDLWLNEAFATWMSYKIVDGWRPEWRVWLDFDQAKASALHLDALRSTHPIRNAEVKNAAEATESFDAITYEKGGAVLRMIEGYLGERPFREGIRAYMKKHGKANATADDLWGALEGASKEPVVELANAWIREPGYPLISARLTGRQLSLSQRRFFSEPGVRADSHWPVPIVLKFKEGKVVREHRLLLREDGDVTL